MSWTRSLLAVLLLSVPAAAETVLPLIQPEQAEFAVAAPPPLRWPSRRRFRPAPRYAAPPRER